MLHLWDTALERLAPLEGRQPGRVSMYVCGPTVSGDPHVGHGRFALAWDVLRRYLTWSGIVVELVLNITDVDDKIIARAQVEGHSPGEVAATYETRWWESMDGLGVARPDHAPHATAWIPQMVELIENLVAAGHAYLGGDGVYFAADTVADYGLLAHQPLDALRAGARVEVDPAAAKRSPADFSLWKAAKPREPSWPSPWGPGRPGWHTECVVMSLGLLGDGFDLHGGGSDLVFPHHENERAQATAAGHRFARHWVHSGMVVAEGGEKMSKSLGNGLSLPDVLAAYDPRALRLLLLQSHYRSPVTVGDTTLRAASETVRGLDTFARNHAGARGSPPDPAAVAAFTERMNDDLDTPRAVAGLFETRRQANGAEPQRAEALASAVVSLFENALGLPLDPSRHDGVELGEDASALALARDQARSEHDWARADALRDQLVASGWIVEDGASGTKIRR